MDTNFHSPPSFGPSVSPGQMKRSPNAFYMPSSPAEIFLYPQKKREKEEDEKEKENDEEEEESEGGEEQNEEEKKKQKSDQQEILRQNRRRTRLYRTLVWLQFSFTVFTCIFILIIMVLIAIILVLLTKTIDRADNAIRGNPVSQMYMKLKHAVDKIPGPGR